MEVQAAWDWGTLRGLAAMPALRRSLPGQARPACPVGWPVLHFEECPPQMQRRLWQGCLAERRPLLHCCILCRSFKRLLSGI